MDFNIDDLKRNLSALSKSIAPKKESPEWVDDIKSINDNTKDISKDTSVIADKIKSLEQDISALKEDLEKEKERAEKAEKSNNWFTVLVAIFSVVLAYGLPIIIDLLS